MHSALLQRFTFQTGSFLGPPIGVYDLWTISKVHLFDRRLTTSWTGVLFFSFVFDFSKCNNNLSWLGTHLQLLTGGLGSRRWGVFEVEMEGSALADMWQDLTNGCVPAADVASNSADRWGRPQRSCGLCVDD